MDIYKCPRHIRKHNFKLFTIYTLQVENYIPTREKTLTNLNIRKS